VVAPIFRDRVEEGTSTTGTGTLTLSGASTGSRTFNSTVPSGATVEACIDDGIADWEVFRGVFTSPDQLTRASVLSSSNGGNLVAFGAGTKVCYLTVSAASLAALNSVRLNPQTANYTLQASDFDGMTRVDFNSASNLVCTIPSFANVPYGNGVSVLIARSGAGELTIAAEANVTVANSSSSTLRAQNSVAAITSKAPDSWALFGDLT
jgi:hypothetical protein